MARAIEQVTCAAKCVFWASSGAIHSAAAYGRAVLAAAVTCLLGVALLAALPSAALADEGGAANNAGSASSGAAASVEAGDQARTDEGQTGAIEGIGGVLSKRAEGIGAQANGEADGGATEAETPAGEQPENDQGNGGVLGSGETNDGSEGASADADGVSESGEEVELPDYSSMSLGELKKEVKAKTAERDDLERRIASVSEQMAGTRELLEEVSGNLEVQLTAANRSVSERYKVQRQYPTIIDALLCAEDWQSFIAGIEYIEEASEATIGEVSALRVAVKSYEKQLISLEADRSEADKKLSRVAAELKAAKEARDEAQRLADLVTNARLKPDHSNWDDEDDFMEEWTERIDDYLAGSPMAGQGKTFAQAAWDNHIDPRFSPAISFAESGKGAVCIRPHNAWGWGAAEPNPAGNAASWDSWEEAINAHVRGLKAGYGYTVTKKGAKKYCPPNWQLWYSRVVEQMNSM